MVKKSSKSVIWLFVILGLGGRTAHADDGLRCGTRLVSNGASQAEVLSKCGQPISASRHVVKRRRLSITVDTWIYDFGPTSFVRILTFENDILCDVETGGYGSEKSAT